MHAIKFAPRSETVLEGWAAPYGGPDNGRDRHNEAFTPSTDFCESLFDNRPVLYEHGLDEMTGTAVVGRVKSFEKRDRGLWAQAELDPASPFYPAIKALVTAGRLFFSTGALAHLVQTTTSGIIKRWPWAELSITTSPANTMATLGWAEAAKHYWAAGLTLPDGLKPDPLRQSHQRELAALEWGMRESRGREIAELKSYLDRLPPEPRPTAPRLVAPRPRLTPAQLSHQLGELEVFMAEMG